MNTSKLIFESIDTFMRNNVSEGKCPKSGCTKLIDGKWRVISNKTGKLWPAHYETEEDALSAIEAYHSKT